MNNDQSAPLVSVVMPCLNEEAALESCIAKILRVFEENNIAGEVVVSDNGSTDNSRAIAEQCGARVVSEPRRGYGYAYLTGMAAARGTYLVMGDADDTYDFSLIPQFIEKLQSGYDYVTGSRYANAADTHNITLLHRFFGNPMLTWMLNTLFGTSYSDVYCGLRAFSRDAYEKIRPVSKGMEYALELGINAKLADLRITEIPIVLMPRKGESKLRTLSDGWRSLRLFLLYCPNKIFYVPGGTLFGVGALLHLFTLMHFSADTAPAFLMLTSTCATICSVIGFQVLNLGLHAKSYSWANRYDEHNPVLKNFYAFFTLEKGLALGIITLLVGLLILVGSLMRWALFFLGNFANPAWISFAASLIIIALGTIFSSLFISAMDMKGSD